MATVQLDFYEPDGTTLIGSLDDTEAAIEVRISLQELGALKLTVSRHLAAASAALLAKGNIVKVAYPLIDADPIAVFALKDDVSQLIHADEEGGELLTVTGPGALWILQHARLREEVYAPGQPARGDWDDEISWNWRGRPYGGIIVRCIEEGQNQPGNPLGAITLDFTREEDSDGLPWAEVAEDFSTPIGSDVLSVCNKLAEAGDLFLVLTPDMVLHAYQSYGRDLTGAFTSDNVRFEKGVNILTELERQTALDRVTHLITRDMDGVYRTFVTPDSFDQAVYGYKDVPWTNDPDQVEKTALNILAISDTDAEAYVLEITPGDSPATGEYLPGPAGTSGHFWPGDEVTLHTGAGAHDLNAVACRVTAVSIVIDEAADGTAPSLHIVPELTVGMPGPSFTAVGNAPGVKDGGPGCICLKLCNPAFPDLVLYGPLDWDGGENVPEVVPIYPSGTGSWPVDPNAVEAADAGYPGSPGHVLAGSGFISDAGSPKLPATAGITYRWAVWAWTGSQPRNIEIRYFSAADVLLQTSIITITTTGSVVQPFSGDFTAPVGSAYQKLVPIAGGGAFIAYDHVIVTQLGSGTSGDLPEDVGLVASVGTGNRAARCDHSHAHGNLSPAGTHHHGTAQIQGYTAGVTDHGALTGLSDDDHPQYATNAELTAHEGTTHGGSGGGRILITSEPAGSPLIFADLLQNSEGTDLLYASES